MSSKWRPFVASLLCVLAAASCGDGEDVKGGGAPVELSSILEKPLDQLTPKQAQALCSEENARFDACLEVAIQESSADACSAALASCRSTNDSHAPVLDCSGLDLGPKGSCPVSVADYLACLDAWNAARGCAEVGYLIETPEACKPVVELCPRFALDFFQDGKPPPCKPPATPPPPDTNDDIYGLDCRPVPARFVVLGDSIAACVGLDSKDCAPNQIADHLKQTLAPGLSFETHAVPGAYTADLPGQAAQVAGGPGHVAVWVYAIGNDLATNHMDYAGWQESWAQVFAYFGDPTRFPDGATFLVNTQYSPYDQCPDPPGPTTGISDALEQLIQDVNKKLFIDVAIARDDTIAVDQYPDFLGHGRNANLEGCPHCGLDNTPWLQADGTHPNALGSAHIAEKWIKALDEAHAPTCASP